MLIDTHCHLDFALGTEVIKKLTTQDIDTITALVTAAHQKSVRKMITIGTDYARSLFSIRIAQEYDSVFCTIGIHPCDAQADWRVDFGELKKLALQKTAYKIVGIGESGLDFYHPNFDVQRQQAVFRAHIELALARKLPLVVHSRKAIDETLAILSEYKKENLTGVLHCFDQDWAIAQDVINLGFYMGIGGIITYPKNNALREVVRNDNLNHLVLETDAPFLPPQIARGKRNEPAHVATIAQYIAELLDVSEEVVAAKTSQNATRLFDFTLEEF